MDPTSPVRILVVDDDALVCETARKILERGGYAVAVARDGSDALAMVHTWKPAAVVTDIVMPREEGLRLVFEVRRLQPAVPIVAISGMRCGAYLPLAKKLGANALLRKPFDPESLLESVRGALAGVPTPPSPQDRPGH